MKFDPTKPVQTRDGRPARIISTDGCGMFSILSLVTDPSGYDTVTRHTVSGSASAFPGAHPLDLINVPDETEEVTFVNLGGSFSNKHSAIQEHPGWPVLKLKLRVGKDRGLEDVREVLSTEVISG